MLVHGLSKKIMLFICNNHVLHHRKKDMTLMYLRKLITICVPKVGMQMCMLIEGIHKINEN